MNNFARKYGDVCLIWLGSTPSIFISHPELVREAFMRTEFSDRWGGVIIESMMDPNQHLVFGRYDANWRRLQRYVNRNVLSHRRVALISETFVEPIMDLHVEAMGALADSGELVYPKKEFFTMSARTMADVIFGVYGYSQNKGMEKALHDVEGAIERGFANAPVHKPLNYFPRLVNFFTNQLTNAKEQFNTMSDIVDFEALKDSPLFDLDSPISLVEVMLADEREGEITIAELKSLIGDLIFAGIETTAQTMTWLILTLANNLEIQDRIFQELESADQDGRRALRMDDMPSLPYTHAALIENMRHRTVVPFGVPHRAARTGELAGYEIPEGAQMLANIHGIHHDERFWDAPYEFKPERFMPQPDGSPSPELENGAYMPFGVGRRGCPGQNLAMSSLWMTTVRMLHNFRFEPPPGIERIPEEEQLGLSLGAKPFAVKVVRR